ncbi:protein-glutamate O-methyltransferase CheR [Sphingomonadaceae bacterium jetA1]|jgi:chemotaxis protein methyltransferase CheR|uniref:CheR family methyltransferase n=1 Tax=Facivitalis istanbulensis TaxID=3075838 RepID=UPI0034855784
MMTPGLRQTMPQAPSVPSAALPASAPVIPASNNAIAVLAALLEARTGQQIASHRSSRVDTVLLPLMRERRFDTLDQLVLALLDGRDPPLANRVIDALVNGETSFFRDQMVFDQVVALAAAAERDGRRARIWSAGCSTGQEPLSLAMLFAERHEMSGAPMPEIVATDVSEAAIQRAKSGCFTQFEVQRGLPIRRLVHWFEGQPNGEWTARPELLRHVSFRQMNLIGDAPPGGAFDAILCRNVMLYLAPGPKARAFRTLASALRDTGGLLLGAGETVIGQTSLFQIRSDLRGVYGKSEDPARTTA